MSNTIVGNVYDQIIEKVIAASRNDFEEMGVDNNTLEELKQSWQDKLSELKIANFPWDPQPEPPRQPPTVPSNVKAEPVGPPPTSQQELVNFPSVQNPHIKTEPSRYEPPISTYGSMNGYSGGGFNGDLAQARAQALVAQRMGQVPGAHNMQMPNQQLQGQMHPQQRMMTGQTQRPPQPQQVQQVQQGQQGQQVQQGQQGQQAQQAQQMQQQRPPPSHIYTSQTDGSDEALEDWKALLRARAAAGDDGPEGRIAADQLMSTQIAAMVAETDSGLGMPLDQMPKGSKRRAIARARQSQRAEAGPSASAAPKVANFDGDDEENDEDAINSDLDDPEDENGAGQSDDDDMLDYMLCTYDKVQRVKNKWKCTLKDGILTTNKKEYLFHKATGEFEW